jgi:hypothetical protein
MLIGQPSCKGLERDPVLLLNAVEDKQGLLAIDERELAKPLINTRYLLKLPTFSQEFFRWLPMPSDTL